MACMATIGIIKKYRVGMKFVWGNHVEHPFQPDDVTHHPCVTSFGVIHLVAVPQMVSHIPHEHTVGTFFY